MNLVIIKYELYLYPILLSLSLLFQHFSAFIQAMRSGFISAIHVYVLPYKNINGFVS